MTEYFGVVSYVVEMVRVAILDLRVLNLRRKPRRTPRYRFCSDRTLQGSECNS